MCVLILLCGMETLSWYAELALRTRVSMSAMGSVMVMIRGLRAFPAVVPVKAYDEEVVGLPAGLGDAGQLARVRHLAEADPAEAERAEHRTGTTAPVAARVAADLELRLAVRLLDERLLRHLYCSLKGKPSARSSARPSSSLVAVVTTVMSMPRVRSTLSTSISWNIDCSVRPKV